MKNDLLTLLDKSLSFSFYSIFFLVPIVVFPNNFELFEFNKMWTVFGFGLLVLFFWVSKMILTGKLLIRRTPLDLPILLFLASQIVSTIFSIDPHVSFWGYYSRFNGGLLSIVTYIFLYYAFVTNMTGDPLRQSEGEARGKKGSNKLLFVSLIAGLVVSLWGLPSHFGYDPTCLLFRGQFNVDCWTDAFQPKVRIFSTLGQPNWMAAYLSILIPISIVFALGKFSLAREIILKKYKAVSIKYYVSSKQFLLATCYVLLATLFYLDLDFTRSQSGFLGFWIGNVFFVALTIFTLNNKFSIGKLFKEKLFKLILTTNVLFLLTNFLFGFPISKLDAFSLSSIQNRIANQKINAPSVKPQTSKAPVGPSLETGITGSGKIRLIVWKGALNIFKSNPLFGSGVETFAYAYYKNRPAEHNLTSEWDFLYNKAHNEYLNYLATTGIFGLGTYLWIIAAFAFIIYRTIRKRSENEFNLISYALVAGYISILVSNFFGFSVVIVNLYFFLLPALFFDYQSLLSEKYFFTKDEKKEIASTSSPYRKVGVFFLALLILYFEFLLFRFWLADKDFALGYNLDKVGEYVKSNDLLMSAVKLRPGEDLFKDELSLNLSTLSLYLSQQNEATQAALFAQQAKAVSDGVIKRHPNNVVFFKTRTRVMYSLASIDPSFMNYAIGAIEKAQNLAPTDPKISYNAALLYNQIGDSQKAIKTLEKTIILKSDYKDAYHAIILFYTNLYTKEKGKDARIAELYKSQAEKYVKEALKLDPSDAGTRELQKSLNMQ